MCFDDFLKIMIDIRLSKTPNYNLMKKIVKKMCFVMFLVISFISCNNEELFVEPINEVEEEENTDTPKDNEDPVIDATEACDFTVDDIQPNSEVIIDCILDLGGETFTLPENVTFIFDGGDIKNGTLNFSGGSVIDGALMNNTLTIGGTKPQVKDPVFTFIPSRWGIVEGVVSDDVARNNRDIIESIMFDIKDFGVHTFQINKMDAYFKIDGLLNESVPELHAINIPSDFNLKMSNETHFRMQPHGHFRASLIAIYDAENITVTGGNLHGEREQHNYNSNFVDSDGATGPSHEWVNTMAIKGGRNIIIDGVTFEDAAGDGIVISSIYFYYEARHIRSKQIQVINNTFKRARRINLTLVNCEQITINNNDFIDGGADLANSTGTAPSCDFNMEPVRSWNGDELIEYERVSDVTISNNRQHFSASNTDESGGGFYFSHGNGPIVFENNEIDSNVSFSTVEGLIIRNNTINSGINAGIPSNSDRVDFVFGNEIYGNTINGGVKVGGNGVAVTDNDIEGNIGVYLGAGAKSDDVGVTNSLIKGNRIKANQRGIMAINSTSNTVIEENTVDMLDGSTFALNLYNSWAGTGDANFVVKNNIVTGTKGNDTGAPTSLIGANSISVLNNKLGSVQITDGGNIEFKNNDIDAEINKDGLIFNSDCPNSTFTENNITLYTSKTPLNIEWVKIKDGVQLSNSVTVDANTFIEK